ncbi:hypothetical protein ABZU76_15765 [Amycolatopsis sp. NPDC005232]|uniref:hypothetical protein n=1 Tax=Amycolatopsis sp. NPDC005232 TaxID=3157027 RepID=UPI0033AB9FB7
MASMEMRGSQRRYLGDLRDALRSSDALRSAAPRLLQERLCGSMLPEERLLSIGGSPP